MYPENEKKIIIDICTGINSVIAKIVTEVKFSYLSEIGELLKVLKKYLQEDFDVTGKLAIYIKKLFEIYNICVDETKKCNNSEFNADESGIYIMQELKKMNDEYIVKIVYYLNNFKN